METEKLSAPTVPLGCFLLLLPTEAELFRTGQQPKQRGLGTACSQSAGWGVLLAGLPRLWAQLGAGPPSPPTPILLVLQGPGRAEGGSSS